MVDYYDNPLPDSSHDYAWRGYHYDSRHHVTREWEYEGATAIDDSALSPYKNMLDSDIDAVANGTTAEPWDREREPDVGALSRIHNPDTSSTRWEATPRTAGHRLDQVAMAGQPFDTISHDNMGNVTQERTAPYSLTNTFDELGRLTSRHVSSMSYDAHGRLTVYDIGIPRYPDPYVFHHDGEQMAGASITASQPLADMIFSPTHQDKLLEVHDYSLGTPQIPLVDGRNNVVASWSAGLGELEGLARYDAEGNLVELAHDETEVCSEPTGQRCNPPGGMPFGFNSMFRSFDGLYYMRNRWYAPKLAQFISHDPLEYVDTSNLYAFAAFDPVNNWDPYGLSKEGLNGQGGMPDETAGGGTTGSSGVASTWQVTSALNRYSDPRGFSWAGPSAADSSIQLVDLGEWCMKTCGYETKPRDADAREATTEDMIGLGLFGAGFFPQFEVPNFFYDLYSFYQEPTAFNALIAVLDGIGVASPLLPAMGGLIRGGFPELDRLYDIASKSDVAGSMARDKDSLWKVPKPPTRAEIIADLPVNQMNTQVLRGQAPRGIIRVDRGTVKGEVPHVHFNDGSALNFDGTWKHSDGADPSNITNDQRAWLEQNGWELPNEQ